MDSRNGRVNRSLLATVAIVSFVSLSVVAGATPLADGGSLAETGDVPAASPPGDRLGHAHGDPIVDDRERPANVTIDRVRVDAAPADTRSDRPNLWAGDPFNVSVLAAVDPLVGEENATDAAYSVCVDLAGADEPVCEDTTVRNESLNGTVSFPGWPGNGTGRLWMNVSVIAEEDGERTTVDSRNSSVQVIERESDTDSDGLNNQEEFSAGTRYNNSDTDDDGLQDGPEINDYETDPLDPDTDDDGVRDGVEIREGTDASDPDTDGDGLDDGTELESGTDPLDADSDGDGLDDGRETDLGTDPLDADTDGDGLDDGRELEIGTDPANPDTDGDMLNDGFEHRYGIGPTNAFLPIVPVLLIVGIAVLAGVVAVRRGVVEIDSGVLPGSAHEESRGEAGGDATAGDDDEDRVPTLDPDANVTLSDDEVVLQLLERNDGRMKQSAIVEQTDWSKAKVSRTLSRMTDEGKVQKLKLGRENLITLKDEVLDMPE